MLGIIDVDQRNEPQSCSQTAGKAHEGVMHRFDRIECTLKLINQRLGGSTGFIVSAHGFPDSLSGSEHEVG